MTKQPILPRLIPFRRGLADFDAIITSKEETCCEASFLLVVLDDIPEVDKNGINE